MPEKLNTLFEFVLKGFDALEYKEHLDYQVPQNYNQNTLELNGVVDLTIWPP